jgi:ferric-dicitrate binding protein FerR (iron transport regulator)
MSTDNSPTLPLPPECERFAYLVEQRASGERVSAEDARWLNAHRQQCAECNLFHQSLRALAVDEPMDAAAIENHQRAVAQRLHKRRVQRQFVWAAAAVVLLSVGGTFLLARQKGRAPSFDLRVVAGSVHLASEREVRSAGSEVGPGQTMVAGEHGTRFVIGRAASVRLAAGSVARFTRPARRTAELLLRSGRAGLQVNREAGVGVVVDTPVASFLVVGTTFFVDSSDQQARLELIEGEVGVTERGGRTFRIRGPSALALPGGVTTALSAERVRALTTELEQELTPADERIEESTLSPADEVDSVPTPQPEADGKRRKARPATPDAISTLLATGRRCRSEQVWTCSAEAYRRLLQRFPNSPEAALALVSLAELELLYLGQPQRALRHYQRYLDLQAGGAFEPDALGGKAKALQKLGRTADEIATLRDLVSRFPLSVNAKPAEQRLRELQERGP